MRFSIRRVAAAMLVASVLVGCGTDVQNVRLRGRVPTSTALRLPGAALSALTATDAVKVIMTSGDNYTVSPIVGGVFEVDVPPDRPAGLILVGPSDEYLGFVSVRGTIPGVPVQALDEGVSTLDLGTLVESGSVLQPGIDPIGNGITLGEAELQALAALGALTRSILSNPDVDADGAIDMLQRRGYALQIGLFRPGSMSGLIGNAPGAVDNWQVGLHVTEEGVTSYPPSITMTGPVGSNIDALVCTGRMGGSNNAYYAVPLPSPSSVPPVGTWSAAYDTRTLTFDVPDLSQLAASSPALVPSVTLNGDQTIRDIGWTWRLADGSTSTTPSNLVVRVTVQINAGPAATRCDSSNLTMFDPTIVYAMGISPDSPRHQLACQNIPWSAVTSLQVGFTDVFGNSHSAGYPVF